MALRTAALLNGAWAVLKPKRGQELAKHLVQRDVRVPLTRSSWVPATSEMSTPPESNSLTAVESLKIGLSTILFR